MQVCQIMRMSPRWAFVVCLVAATCADESSPQYDCIVVGMGAAGTVAAATLARGGKRVLALEATERVGGRVRTVPFAGGVVELGAEWIHGQYPSRVYSAARAHNVTVLSQELPYAMLQSDGAAAGALARELYDEGAQYTHQRANHSQPRGQYVTNKLMSYISEKHPELLQDTELVGRVLDFLDRVVDSVEGSDSWLQVDAAASFEPLNGSEVYSWHTHGYNTFFEIMLNTYKGGPGLPSLEIKLNSPVTRVQWPQQAGQPVQVTCSDGRQYSADTAIVTLSLGVLKEKHNTLFDPPLPQNKVTAIEKLAMGVVGKIILCFDEVWWPNMYFGFLWKSDDLKKVPPEDMWTTKVVGMIPSMGCNHCFSLWTCGETAKLMERLPEEEVKMKSMALLRRFLAGNKTIPEPSGFLKSSWFSNEWTRGTYSYGGMSAADVPAARQWLGSPLPEGGRGGRARLLLAGEAAHRTRYSTVHGAADSGHDAAMMLLGKH